MQTFGGGVYRLQGSTSRVHVLEIRLLEQGLLKGQRQPLVAPVLRTTCRPYGGVLPIHQKSICPTQSTLGPCVVKVWSRNARNFKPTKPSSYSHSKPEKLVFYILF